MNGFSDSLSGTNLPSPKSTVCLYQKVQSVCTKKYSLSVPISTVRMYLNVQSVCTKKYSPSVPKCSVRLYQKVQSVCSKMFQKCLVCLYREQSLSLFHSLYPFFSLYLSLFLSISLFLILSALLFSFVTNRNFGPGRFGGVTGFLVFSK